MVLHCVSLQAYIRELKELLVSVAEDSVMVRTTRGVGGERWWGEEGGGEGGSCSCLSQRTQSWYVQLEVWVKSFGESEPKAWSLHSSIATVTLPTNLWTSLHYRDAQFSQSFNFHG